MKVISFGLSQFAIFSFIFLLTSCSGTKNPIRPFPAENEAGKFITVRDGMNIFVYEHVPDCEIKCTIYIVSGITGINHKSEKDLIELLSNNVNRVVVIHPRGTGYSEGERGDNSDLSDFIGDYTEIIKKDRYSSDRNHKIFLFGHSMSCAIAVKVANELHKTDGIILVNPPYRLKSSKGMSPSFKDYLRYIGYYIFAPNVPVVNMAGDPSIIENDADRRESEKRNSDPLLVKYFSMNYMNESKKIMDAIYENARHADYPLLLLYGENDMIVDSSGCNDIFSVWKCQDKEYKIINDGSHGKSTVLKGSEIIKNWIYDQKAVNPVLSSKDPIDNPGRINAVVY
ncbi:MAG: alpha/beta fold hydrolase [Bacteroidetes bacterium]|nr:alpha/beta fold hydrolase [Bacteroidota bacterium]